MSTPVPPSASMPPIAAIPPFTGRPNRPPPGFAPRLEEPQRAAPLRKTRSLSEGTQLIPDVVSELFRGNDDPTSPRMLQKAKSDPERVYLTHMPRLLYQFKSESQLDFPQNVHTKSIIKNLYAQFSEDPFMRKVSEKTASDYFILKRENLTHHAIASPRKCALEAHAEAYGAKYGISIHLSTLANLTPLIQRISHAISKPSYVSFIVAESDKHLETEHVAPLLCSFGLAGTECLIMDVLGRRTELAKKLSLQLVRDGITSRKNVITAIGDRQVDGFSCRTGALSLLRNAHLSLRFHHFSEGIKEPLRMLLEAPIDVDLKDTDLPGEWTYVEQIFSGNQGRLAIRDLFSKKIEKKTHPRTIELFRRQYMEENRFFCTLSSTNNYQADFAGLVPPPGIEVAMDDQLFTLTFEITRSVNTYLLHKGFKRAGLERIPPS